MSGRQRLLGAIVLGLYLIVQIGPAWTAVRASQSGRDFATYHYAVQVAAEGGDPYSVRALGAAAREEGTRRSVHPYFYPPPFLLAVAWTLPLSMPAAYQIFFWMNQAFLGLTLWVLRRWTGASWLSLGLVAATLTPLGDATKMGQANHLVLLLLSVALWRTSGAWLSAAAMAKMSPALLLSWWGARIHWKPVFIAALGAVLWSVAALVLVDFPTQLRFYTEILPGFSSGEYHGLKVPITIPANHSIPDLYNQLWPGPSKHRLSEVAQRAASLTSLGLLAGLVVYARRTRDAIGDAALAGAFTVLMVVTPVYTYEHHFALLLLPAVALARAWEVGRLGRTATVLASVSYFFAAWPLYVLRPLQKSAPDSLSWFFQESKFAGAVGLALMCLWAARNSQSANK